MRKRERDRERDREKEREIDREQRHVIEKLEQAFIKRVCIGKG